MRAGGATTTTTSMHGEDEDEGDEGDEEIEVVLGGRDAAVCYANRAAARLMRAAEGKDAIAHARGPSSKDAIAHARETRLALADCRAALVADAGFDRARLRAGTCLMRLGFFAAAERVLARSVSAEARGLAKDASRARATVEELRGGALDRLRAATMTGAARGALVAKRRAALLAEGAGWAKARSVSAEAANASDSDASIAAFFSIASRARRVADLAPHCAAAAEASARASMFAGDFADAVAFADREGIGGEGNEDGSETWRAMCRATCRVAVGALEEAVSEKDGNEDAEDGDAEDGSGDGSGDAELGDARKKLEAARELELLEDLRAFARDQTARRAEGNALFKAGKYAEASAAYTAAVAAASSHPLASATTATTLCNRAATAHAEGRLVDALADCGRALALNPAHAKALSRRAQIHAELRLWDAAVDDLERLAAMVAFGDVATVRRRRRGVRRRSRRRRIDDDPTRRRENRRAVVARAGPYPRVGSSRGRGRVRGETRVSKIGARAPPG